MKKNKWGRFITITSYAVKQPVDGLLLSNSVRAAVTGLARTLADEYSRAWHHRKQRLAGVCDPTDRLGDLANAMSARTSTKPEDVFSRLGASNPHGKNWYAGRICPPWSRLSRFGACQLREWHFHRGRWWHCEEPAIASMPASIPQIQTLLLFFPSLSLFAGSPPERRFLHGPHAEIFFLSRGPARNSPWWWKWIWFQPIFARRSVGGP